MAASTAICVLIQGKGAPAAQSQPRRVGSR
jgi:hypothetical protein